MWRWRGRGEELDVEIVEVEEEVREEEEKQEEVREEEEKQEEEEEVCVPARRRGGRPSGRVQGGAGSLKTSSRCTWWVPLSPAPKTTG